MESKVKKVAILTNGGDAPGLNAVIRAIVKTARTYGVECYGFIEGYKGLLFNNYVKLDLQGNASGLLTKGGTIIGTSNATNVFNYKVVNEDGSVEYKDLSDVCVQNIKNAGFDCIFTLGGDGTQKSSRDFSLKGVNCIKINSGCLVNIQYIKKFIEHEVILKNDEKLLVSRSATKMLKTILLQNTQ